MVPSIIDVWGYDREFCSSSPSSSSNIICVCESFGISWPNRVYWQEPDSLEAASSLSK